MVFTSLRARGANSFLISYNKISRIFQELLKTAVVCWSGGSHNYQNFSSNLMVSEYISFDNIGLGRFRHVSHARRKNRVPVICLSIHRDESYETLAISWNQKQLT